MRLSTVFSVLTCGAMALAAAVAPDALVSRSNSGISKVIDILDMTLDTILPKLDNCKDSGCTEGVVVEIAAAIDRATHTVDLKGSVSWSAAREILGVAVKISVKLEAHRSSCDHDCGDLVSVYAKIDVSISSLLKELGTVVSGISDLVRFMKHRLKLGS